MASAAPALRHIASEIVITVRRKDPRIDVRVTVVPEGVVAPNRIIIDVVIGERPEQRPDPSISAVAVLPPSVRVVAAAVPARQCGSRGDLPARGGIAEQAYSCAIRRGATANS